MISETLKKIMKQKGISARQVILNTRLHQTAVYNVLKMGSNPKGYNVSTLKKVCEFLEYDLKI